MQESLVPASFDYFLLGLQPVVHIVARGCASHQKYVVRAGRNFRVAGTMIGRAIGRRPGIILSLAHNALL